MSLWCAELNDSYVTAVVRAGMILEPCCVFGGRVEESSGVDLVVY
jgi:hypothetical protein